MEKQKTNKLKLMGKNHSDELYTPKEAIKILVPYLKQFKVIWECAWGTGKLAEHLEAEGFKVLHKGDDFINALIKFIVPEGGCSIIVSSDRL